MPPAWANARCICLPKVSPTGIRFTVPGLFCKASMSTSVIAGYSPSMFTTLAS